MYQLESTRAHLTHILALATFHQTGFTIPFPTSNSR